MSREASLALATAARKAKTITAAESRVRFAYVERLLVNDVSPAEILQRCRARHGMREGAVERVKTRVFEAWADADAQLRELRRAQQRRRVMRLIRKATKANAWRALVAGEALLAKIDGTVMTDSAREDTAADRQRDTLYQILKSMTPAELESLASDDSDAEERSRIAAN